jgi:hypothetical protein
MTTSSGSPPDDLIPPDDPRFEGARFISNNAMIEHKIQTWPSLRGACWRRAVWRERSAVFTDRKTGEQTPTVWDHDHCEICHQGFSERYADDLREGWAMPGPAGLPTAEWQPDYHWLCPRCYEQYRERLGWTSEG